MDNNIKRTKREIMIVQASGDGIGGVASGLLVASFLLLVAGFLGLLWSPISAIIILGFVGYNMHKAYVAYITARDLIREAYNEPLTLEAFTEEEWHKLG